MLGNEVVGKSIPIISRIFFVLSIIILSSQVVMAIGASPSSLNFEHLQKGSNANKILIISGASATDHIIIRTEGEVGSWLSFDGCQNHSRGVRCVLQRNEENNQLILPINIAIPKDIPNNVYESKFTLMLERDSTSGEQENSASVAVEEVIAIKVKVEVTGDQVEDYDINLIEILDSEEEELLPILIKILNEGNIEARLEKVSLTISDPQEETFFPPIIVEAIPGVEPFTEESVRLLAEHSLSAGQYWGFMTIVGENGKMWDEKIFFEIFPKGTFETSFSFDSLSIDEEINKSLPVKIVAKTTNTGKIAGVVKLDVEVEHNGDLIEVLESQPLLLHPGQKEELVAYVTPKEFGSYTITGQLSFLQKKSEKKSQSFNIIEEKPSFVGAVIQRATTPLSFTANTLSPISLILILAIIGVVLRQKRRRKE